MKKGELFVCVDVGISKCESMIEILADCERETTPPVCCGNPMALVDGGYEVKVGEIPHQMLEKHFISFNALATSNMVYQKFLMPDEESVAFFLTKNEVVSTRAFCNIHGLCKSSFEINFRHKFSEIDHF